MDARLSAILALFLVMFGAVSAEAVIKSMTAVNSPAQSDPEIQCSLNHVDSFPWRVYTGHPSSHRHHH